jgi:16S rRNA (guanine527-N7)-methyltransferase
VNGTGAQLRMQLERARELGFLGPGPVESHIEHAHGFAVVAERVLGRPPERLADLGSGGGVPGIVLALRWTSTAVALVESSNRRAGFLRETVELFGVGDRVAVVDTRAETAARDPELREAFEVVTARGFGPPAVTAEIAAGFVEIGGVVVVSEPPAADASRWPAEMPPALGLGSAQPHTAAGAHFAVMMKGATADGTIPRASGRVAKRPLW